LVDLVGGGTGSFQGISPFLGQVCVCTKPQKCPPTPSGAWHPSPLKSRCPCRPHGPPGSCSLIRHTSHVLQLSLQERSPGGLIRHLSSLILRDSTVRGRHLIQTQRPLVLLTVPVTSSVPGNLRCPVCFAKGDCPKNTSEQICPAGHTHCYDGVLKLRGSKSGYPGPCGDCVGRTGH
jgi:hypothetical protein